MSKHDEALHMCSKGKAVDICFSFWLLCCLYVSGRKEEMEGEVVS
jgi:hypothetical protein